LRFFIGLVEATCWPGFVAQFILLRYWTDNP
jgi:hypothetical protein